MRNPDRAPAGEPIARRVRDLIVQEHPLLATAMAEVLEGQPDLAVSSVCASGAAAVKATAHDRPDVVLMDFRLPDLTGPEAARMIQNEHAQAAMVFHSADASEKALRDAVDAGAIAYLTRRRPEIRSSKQFAARPLARCSSRSGCLPAPSPGSGASPS